MTIEERKADIIGTKGIEASELVHEHGNTFKSIEYYLIIHMTNAELFYGGEMDLNQYLWCFDADEYVDTNKGRIFYVK